MIYISRGKNQVLKKVIHVFKMISSGRCETSRAHWIPFENLKGKSCDLLWMFIFLLQLSDGTEYLLHFRLYSVSNIFHKHHSHNYEADKHK